MPTGVCGINCDTCKLKTEGICITCGSGTSREAAEKIAAQKRLFGQACPILACAVTNGIDYCMKDCGFFPCETFQAGPYPFSQGFLGMQDRRRKEAATKKKIQENQKIAVPVEFWEKLEKIDLKERCRVAVAGLESNHSICLRFLATDILIDLTGRTIQKKEQKQWHIIKDTMLELLCLVYLLRVTNAPLKREMANVRDLKEGHFFQGPHEIETSSLLARFGSDPDAFRRASENIGGRQVTYSDIAYVFTPFPKILQYYLLWAGDEEFPPRMSILFDRSIEDHFPADFIWGLTNYVSSILVSSQ